VSAPASVSRPPRIQTARISPGWGRARPRSAGARKMAAPRTRPTVMTAPSQPPTARASPAVPPPGPPFPVPGPKCPQNLPPGCRVRGVSKESHNRADLVEIARRAMAERGLEPDFSALAESELQRIPGPAPAEEPGARDLRGLLWCSIDNDDSKDLD